MGDMMGQSMDQESDRKTMPDMAETEKRVEDLWYRPVRRLWALLDAVVVEEDSVALPAMADAWHDWAIAWRSGQKADVPTVSDDDMFLLIRLLSERLRIQNLAEDLARARTLEARRKDGANPPRGSIDGFAAKLTTVVPPNRADRTLFGRIVLTFHPTESTRRTILQHVRKLSRLASDVPEAASVTADLLIARIREELRALWRTPSQRTNRPSVLDELELGLFYLREGLFDILPDVLGAINRVLGPHNLPVLDWGVDSWIGGDRDGHPFVDAGVTEHTFQRHRQTVLKLYLQPLKDLERTVTGARRFITNPTACDRWLADAGERFPEVAEEMRRRYPQELLRQMVGLIHARITATLDGQSTGYPHALAFWQDVHLLGRFWDEVPVRWPAELTKLLGQIEVFGFHLATLDIRQHSRIHEQAVTELVGQEYDQLSESERLIPLSEFIRRPRAWIPADAATSDLRDTLAVVARAQRLYGPRAVTRYLVSMAHQASDLLEVLTLTRAVDPDLSLDIVPVFETLDDLRKAPGILSEALHNAEWRQHLKARNNYQEIMLGYSDSTKDAGTVTASWAIYQAERELLAWGDSHGVRVGFFHGRGGSLGRGGGPTSHAILAQPAETAWHPLRITQQGEVLSQKFLFPDIAWRSLELMMTAHATAAVFPAVEPDVSTEQLMERMAHTALTTYRDLVQAPNFWEYFLAVTPIREMSALNWGSRPSWREQFCWDDLRAIPWVFSWTQNRVLLPGWYGAGTALQEALREGPEHLQRLAVEWPFMSTLLHNLELALVKADLHAAEWYQSLADSALVREFWTAIKAEHDRLYSALLTIKGTSSLLVGQERLARAVHWRNPQVDTLNYLQVELLRSFRAGGRDDLLPALAQTMEGIALGLRNSG